MSQIMRSEIEGEKQMLLANRKRKRPKNIEDLSKSLIIKSIAKK